MHPQCGRAGAAGRSQWPGQGCKPGAGRAWSCRHCANGCAVQLEMRHLPLYVCIEMHHLPCTHTYVFALRCATCIVPWCRSRFLLGVGASTGHRGRGGDRSSAAAIEHCDAAIGAAAPEATLDERDAADRASHAHLTPNTPPGNARRMPCSQWEHSSVTVRRPKMRRWSSRSRRWWRSTRARSSRLPQSTESSVSSTHRRVSPAVHIRAPCALTAFMVPRCESSEQKRVVSFVLVQLCGTSHKQRVVVLIHGSSAVHPSLPLCVVPEN